MFVYIYMCLSMFLINVSQEAGSHPVIQVRSFHLNFKEQVVLKPLQEYLPQLNFVKSALFWQIQIL